MSVTNDTVLHLIQYACYEMNIPAPSSVFGSTDPSVLQHLNNLYATGRDLRQAKCWPQLKKNYQFTTSNGASSYDLPSDFYCSLLDTYWDTTNRWKLAGPETDARQNELLYGYATFSNREYFRIFGLPDGKQISVYPTPGTTTLTLSFDYIQKNWILHSAAWQETLGADSDTTAFDDDLMILGIQWRWKKQSGFDYQEDQQEYQSKIDKAVAKWQGSKKGTMFFQNALLAGLSPNTPEGNYTL